MCDPILISLVDMSAHVFVCIDGPSVWLTLTVSNTQICLLVCNDFVAASTVKTLWQA